MKISFMIDTEMTHVMSDDELLILRKLIFKDPNVVISTVGKEESVPLGKTPITIGYDPAPDSFTTKDEVRVLRGTTCEYAALPPDENGNKPFQDSIGNTTIVVPPAPPSPPVISAAPPSVTVTPPPAPNTQEPAAISTGTDAELDSDGVAWDPTIHSETRMKNANGTWRKRRTTKNVEVKQSIPGLEHLTPNSVPAPPSRKMVNTFVRINGAQELIKAPDGATDEELSAITGQPTVREDRYNAMQPQVTGYQPSAAPGSPIPPPPSGGSSVMPPPPPAAPPAPAAVKTAPQGAPAGTFAELMERVTKYFGSQSITTQDLIEVCATFSIKSVQECYAQPALIPLVSNAIDEKVKARMGAA